MGLSMNKILNRFNDSDKFSLSDSSTLCRVSDSEFENALTEFEDFIKKEALEKYDKETFKDYQSFDEIYENIKKECLEFCSDENRQLYLDNYFTNEMIKELENDGINVEEFKENFFECSLIVDNVGITTKYGKKNKSFFWNLYYKVGMLIELEKKKNIYCSINKLNPIERIPEKIKPYLISYKVSFFNEVTECGDLLINYFFELNEETKKYLMGFRNDFCLNDLEDLVLYKNNEIKFYSCTHERFNSIEFNYKEMNKNEIVDFINDEYFETDNKIIIDVVNKLIEMNINNVFSFKELGVLKQDLMEKICNICEKINLKLISTKYNSSGWNIVNQDGFLEETEELPALFCTTKDLIKKIC